MQIPDTPMTQRIVDEIPAGVGPGRMRHHGCATSDPGGTLLPAGCDAHDYDDLPNDTLDGRIHAAIPIPTFDTPILDRDDAGGRSSGRAGLWEKLAGMRSA